jgi:ABC-type xylose transport system permease subunit
VVISGLMGLLIGEAVSTFVASPVLPSVIVVLATSAPVVGTLNSVLVTQTTPKVAPVPMSNADVSFLHSGFLKPSFLLYSS